MIEREHAGEILTEMVEIVRAFKMAGQRSRERTLTGTKIGILQHLRRGDARLGELADRQLVSASVTSRAVDSLEADGMVERRADSQDGRAFLISITDRGRKYLTERESYFVDKFAEALIDWTPEEAQQAISMLQKLNTHLGTVTESMEPTASPGHGAQNH